MQYEALGYLAAGMGFFGLLGLAAAYNDKASRIPWVGILLPMHAAHQKHSRSRLRVLAHMYR